jgi:hypothetical protein
MALCFALLLYASYYAYSDWLPHSGCGGINYDPSSMKSSTYLQVKLFVQIQLNSFGSTDFPLQTAQWKYRVLII